MAVVLWAPPIDQPSLWASAGAGRRPLPPLRRRRLRAADADADAAHVPPPPPLLLGDISLVLVSPKTAENVGAALRVAGNFEAREVVVVAPRCDVGADAVALVARDSPAALRVVPTLAAALGAARASIGLTRRTGGGRAEVHASLAALLRRRPELLPALPPAGEGCEPGGGSGNGAGGVALVLGREESGLLDAEVSLCSHACAIPTGRRQPSMNLSHAAAVVLAQLYERRAAAAGAAAALEGGPVAGAAGGRDRPATQADVEALLARAAALLRRAGLPAGESSGGGAAAGARRRLPMGHVRAVLGRAALTVPEVRALHSLLGGAEARVGD